MFLIGGCQYLQEFELEQDYISTHRFCALFYCMISEREQVTI